MVLTVRDRRMGINSEIDTEVWVLTVRYTGGWVLTVR